MKVYVEAGQYVALPDLQVYSGGVGGGGSSGGGGVPRVVAARSVTAVTALQDLSADTEVAVYIFPLKKAGQELVRVMRALAVVLSAEAGTKGVPCIQSGDCYAHARAAQFSQAPLVQQLQIQYKAGWMRALHKYTDATVGKVTVGESMYYLATDLATLEGKLMWEQVNFRPPPALRGLPTGGRGGGGGSQLAVEALGHRIAGSTLRRLEGGGEEDASEAAQLSQLQAQVRILGASDVALQGLTAAMRSVGVVPTQEGVQEHAMARQRDACRVRALEEVLQITLEHLPEARMMMRRAAERVEAAEEGAAEAVDTLLSTTVEVAGLGALIEPGLEEAMHGACEKVRSMRRAGLSVRCADARQSNN